MIKIVRARDYTDMSRKAANIISAQVILKPNCVLGLATGDSPIGTYDPVRPLSPPHTFCQHSLHPPLSRNVSLVDSRYELVARGA